MYQFSHSYLRLNMYLSFSASINTLKIKQMPKNLELGNLNKNKAFCIS